jgi:formylglycine-generating enzyme required for sulfatase activity/serine/threonine protein kinase
MKRSLFKFVAKAALECVGFGIAGEFVAEVLPEMARAVYGWWVKDRPAAEVRAELEAVAQVGDEEARRLAVQAVAEEARCDPALLPLQLVSYLTQLPAAVRQTQRRPADPTGRTVVAGLTLRRPADVLALLPPRPPRFHRGQRAPGFADWELEELLGIGGFGEVWKARNPHLPPVALKFCLDATAAAFLRNEADLLGRVVSHGKHHPGIVALLNTSLSGEPPCLMYEYVPGSNLTGLVQQWQSNPPADRDGYTLAIVRQLADVVAFAHKLNPPIVHRDLKPANILLSVGQAFPPDSDGRRVRRESLTDGTFDVKVADFGIGGIVAAQAMGALGDGALPGRSQPTVLRGSCTPLYASPQQMRGDAPDPRDDVFALGVVWYQLLAGDLTERPGADWREELSGMAERHANLLGRCLAVRAERRLPNAVALAEELARLGEPVVQDRHARPAPVAVSVPDVPAEGDEDSDDPLDLAGQLQKSLTRAQQTLARAVELTEQQHDYATAVRLLEGLPEAFRDSAFLEVVRERRDRVVHLRQEVRGAARALRFAGLRDQVEELLDLVPEDEEARKLLRVVPWEPGAEVVNAVGMKLKLVPAGTVAMGSLEGEAGRSPDEGPRRVVEISSRFYLGACPVTQEQYQRVTNINPSHFRVVPGHDTRQFPVENVTWEEALAFCRLLSDLPEEKGRGRSYRLPTEAEWEYACRGGGESGQPFAVGWSLSSLQANFDGRRPYGPGSKGNFLGRTSAAGSYPANGFGLFDMHGNVWEWVADWYDACAYRKGPRRDPEGPRTGSERVLRGGSWQNHGRLCRAACRDRAGPGYRSLNAGFRVVLVVRGG